MGLIGLVLERIKSFWTFVARQVGYVKDLRKSYDNLHERAAVLNSIRDDVNLKMTEDKEEMPTTECKAWLENVRNIENQIIEIEKEYEKNEKYLGGWCTDVSSRWKLGKLINETIDRITEISEYGGSVVVNAHCNLQQEIEWMRDDKIGENGVRASGGVWKTVLMEIQNYLPEIIEVVDICIWAPYAEEWSRRKVQSQILNMIWCAICRMLRLPVYMPLLCKDVLASWLNGPLNAKGRGMLNSKGSTIRKLVTGIGLWCMWDMRNVRMF